MYAIAFDIDMNKLKKEHGEVFTMAYDEMRLYLEHYGFVQTFENLYISRDDTNTLVQVYKAIQKLSGIMWFKKSVRDIRAFKVEDWSNFTDIVKSE